MLEQMGEYDLCQTSLVNKHLSHFKVSQNANDDWIVVVV